MYSQLAGSLAETTLRCRTQGRGWGWPKHPQITSPKLFFRISLGELTFQCKLASFLVPAELVTSCP